ncbi:STAS domain-containing protein [Luedemannella helvata]|uniref:Anti-sigma factor antagonist n=1 Tax=Luedemannella helvata TaxID=349315 RepID=A0ABP4X3Q3_9ACTN
MAFAVSVADAASVSVLAVEGELDMTTAPQLAETAEALMADGHGRLVLDLGGLTFCDSAGLGAIVRIFRQAGDVGGSLAIAQPTPIVRAVLDLTGMSEVIMIYPNVPEARAAVG